MTRQEYHKLLDTHDWNLFRMEILIRDKFRCARCFNSQLISCNGIILKKLQLFYIPYEADPDIPKHENQPIFTTDIFSDWALNPKFLYNKLSTSEFIKATQVDQKNIYIAVATAGNLNKEYGIASSDTLGEEDISSSKLLENLGRVEWLYFSGLNVHHEYYQDGLLPWNYSKTCLITLCNVCHNQFHLNNKVPILDRNGNRKKSNNIEL